MKEYIFDMTVVITAETELEAKEKAELVFDKCVDATLSDCDLHMDIGSCFDDSDTDYGCDDVEGHIASCEDAGLHMSDSDETGLCNVCGHKRLN